MPIPGTGRERNQVLDAGDVLSLPRQAQVRYRPFGSPSRALRLSRSPGCCSSTRARSRRYAPAVFLSPAYNQHSGRGKAGLGRAARPGSPASKPRGVSARLARRTVRPKRRPVRAGPASAPHSQTTHRVAPPGASAPRPESGALHAIAIRWGVRRAVDGLHDDDVIARAKLDVPSGEQPCGQLCRNGSPGTAKLKAAE